MDLGLEGKVAVVAAASKGLGKAVAQKFAQEGAAVAICGRDSDRIEAAAKEIRAATKAQVLAVPADLTRAEEIDRFVQRSVGEFGRIDALVCNAGGPPPGLFTDLDDEAWPRAVQLTLMSAVRLMRSTLPYLKASGNGRTGLFTDLDDEAWTRAVQLTLMSAVRLMRSTRLDGLVVNQAADLRPLAQQHAPSRTPRHGEDPFGRVRAGSHPDQHRRAGPIRHRPSART
jgi:NAD(P)-dependent dehydrogenase (short-subunit alcohol dehydrogenase family)